MKSGGAVWRSQRARRAAEEFPTAVVKPNRPWHQFNLVRLTAGIQLDSTFMKNKIAGQTTADRGAHLVRQPDQRFARHTMTFLTCGMTSVNHWNSFKADLME